MNGMRFLIILLFFVGVRNSSLGEPKHFALLVLVVQVPILVVIQVD